MATAATAAPALKPKLKIDGAPAGDALERLLTELVLDDSLHLPDVLDLTFSDFNAGFLETSPFKIGSKIILELTAPGQPPTKFEGECVSLGARYRSGRFEATIRAFDISHRLNRGRITKTYEQMTASDVVGKILADAGITKGTIDSTSTTYPFLTVANEAPFAFIRRLAAEHGCEAVAMDGKMHFRKPPTPPAPITLTPGGSLLSIDIEISAADQVKDIQVTGWDPKQKKAVVGNAKVSSGATNAQLKPDTISTKMGTTGKLVIGGRPIDTQSHADAVAKATAEQAGSAAVDVRGTVSGHTGLRAGGRIKLEGVGKEFSCEYTLSTTRHIWNQHAGYITEFTVSGQQDRSLGGLVQGTQGSSPERTLSGVVSAVVTDNKDPDKLGRVRVALKWLDANHVSGWARVAFPGGGADRGVTFIPDVNDEVLVAFEHGDPDKPIVVGGMFNGKDKFPEHKGDAQFDRGKVNQYGLFTHANQLAFADKQGEEAITLGLRDKTYQILIDKKGTVITIGSDGKVEVKAKQGVTITADQGNIELTAKAGDVKIGGMNVKVEAKAQMDLSSTGPAKLKGATVAIG